MGTQASAEPGGVQLGLVLDAGIHFKHFANGHGRVGRRRERKIHLQSSVFAFCQARKETTDRKSGSRRQPGMSHATSILKELWPFPRPASQRRTWKKGICKQRIQWLSTIILPGPFLKRVGDRRENPCTMFLPHGETGQRKGNKNLMVRRHCVMS